MYLIRIVQIDNTFIISSEFYTDGFKASNKWHKFMTYDFINQVLMSTKSFLTFFVVIWSGAFENQGGGEHKLFRINDMDKINSWLK